MRRNLASSFICLSTLLLMSPAVLAEDLSALGQALHRSDPFIRSEATDALIRMGSPAVPVLRRALKDEDYEIRSSAAYALGQIDPEPGVVNDLAAATKDEVPSVSRHAVWALVKIGTETPGVIPALLNALDSRDHDVRTAAAKAVGLAGYRAPGVPERNTDPRLPEEHRLCVSADAPSVIIFPATVVRPIGRGHMLAYRYDNNSLHRSIEIQNNSAMYAVREDFPKLGVTDKFQLEDWTEHIFQVLARPYCDRVDKVFHVGILSPPGQSEDSAER